MSDSEQSITGRQRRRTSIPVLILALAAMLGGCGTQGTKTDTTPSHAKSNEQEIVDKHALEMLTHNDLANAEEIVIPPEPIWTRLRSGFSLDVVEHPRVAQEIRRLQRYPNAYRAMMARSEPYLHHILNEIDAAGLPYELALLPAVESGFRPEIYSTSGAAGLWQFMPATGKMLGLKQDWWVDRRRTVRASTQAAINYLKQLNERFDGDWALTLAAYNAGAGTVSRAIRRAERKGGKTDFWSLDLPGETDQYVPRLLALCAVVTDPEHYALDLPEILDQPYFVVADTAGQIDLNVAAELAEMSVEELLALNAGHRRWASSPDGPHELLMPADNAELFKTALADLPTDKRLRWQRHAIKPGDTLSQIARRYGVTADVIRQANNLKGSSIRAGRHLKIPLSDGANFTTTASNGNAKQRLKYRVRKGDSLYKIARRFQVSIADLKRWNQVGRYIRPGERITVFIDPDADT